MTREEKIKLINKFCDAHENCSNYSGDKKDVCALCDFKDCAFERYEDDELDEALSIISKERNEFLKKALEEFKPIVCATAIDNNNVNHPTHYNSGGIECIAGIKASMSRDAYCGFLKGNVLKYLWRYEHKNGIEDLRKAKVYLDWLIAEHGEHKIDDSVFLMTN